MGSFITPPPEYFEIAVGIIKKYGGVFICDEVQTGWGRTGKLFAHQHYGLEPDLLCVAKSMAGGLPMGAALFSARLGELIKRGAAEFAAEYRKQGWIPAGRMSCSNTLEMAYNDACAAQVAQGVGENAATELRERSRK